MSSIRLAAVLGTALVVGIAATGCSSGTPPPGASASPARTAAPAATGEPTPRFDLTCDDLVSRVDLRSLFADRTTAVDPPSADPNGADGIPRPDYVRAAGGLSCAWTNGKADDGSANRSAMSATMSILPATTAGWQKYRADYGLRSDTQAYCSGDATITSCYLDAFSGGYWLEADFENIHARLNSDSSPVIAPAKAVFARALGRVSSLGAPGPQWTPPADTLRIPRTCDGYVSAKQLEAALGTSAKIQLVGPDSGSWSLDAQAEQDAAGIGCLFSAGNAEEGYGDISWLPGGSWAAAKDPVVADSHAISVPGLERGDSASGYTSAQSGGVYVDLVIGGNWVQFDLWPTAAGADLPATAVPITTSATRIAADIVANLRG